MPPPPSRCPVSFEIKLLAAMVFGTVIWTASFAYVVWDAGRRHAQPVRWGIGAAVFGPAVVAYWIRVRHMRPRPRRAAKPFGF